MIYRSLTQTQKKYVGELWDEGITVSEIVCRVHATFPQVQKALEEFGAIQKKPDKKGTSPYLTISDVAKILGLSFSSVTSWRKSGQMVFEKLEKNGRWYIHRDNLLSFLESKNLTSFLTHYYSHFPFES